MRPRLGSGDYYERLVQRETARLPEDLQALWARVKTSNSVPTATAKNSGKLANFKGYRNQANSTKSLALTTLNSLARAAIGEGRYDQGFFGLLDASVLHELFEGPLAKLSGITKWKYCRVLWRFAWAASGLDAQHLLVGGRRYRAESPGKGRAVDRRLQELLLVRAEQLVEDVKARKDIDLHAAVQARTAAHMAVLAIAVSRLSETALVDISQVVVEDDKIVVHVSPAHSKVRKGGREVVKGRHLAVVRFYLGQPREFLLKRGGKEATGALWVTARGLKAEACTMASALRRETRRLMPGGVASGDVRRAAASRGGQGPGEVQRALRHAPGSRTGMRVYRDRDRVRAVEQNSGMTTLRDGDIPTFRAPAVPSGKRRNLCPAATRLGDAGG